MKVKPGKRKKKKEKNGKEMGMKMEALYNRILMPFQYQLNNTLPKVVERSGACCLL